MDEEDKQYKEKMKNTANQFSETAKDKAKKKIKESVIDLGAKEIAKGIAILILIGIAGTILATVFFALVVYFDDLDTKAKAATTKETSIGNEALNTILTIEGGKYKISYNEKSGKEALEEILADNDMNFKDFTDEEIECLYKCLKAEWATTYPNLGESIDNSNLESQYVQGVITIKRGKSDGNIANLSYKPYEEFSNIKDETALDYFSMKDGNIIVANWSSNEIEYMLSDGAPDNIKEQYTNTGKQISITETSINYRNMIGIHTIPFELVLSLLVNTEDVDFVNDLADLAFNSTIELTVYDNIKAITTTEVEHTNEIKTYEKWVDYYIKTTETEVSAGGVPGRGSSSNSATVEDAKINPVTEKIEIDYTLTTKTTTEDNSYVVGVTNVSSWLGDINNEYTYRHTEGQEESLEPGRPVEYTEEGEKENLNLTTATTDSDIIKFKNSKYVESEKVDSWNNSKHIIKKECIIESARKKGTLKGIHEVTEVKIRTDEYKYDVGTKKTSNIGMKFKEVYNKYKKAQAQLDCVESWLFEMLEDTESTVDYVSVMKYLLYICTGNNYGVSEEDLNDLLDVMEIKDLATVNSTNSFDQFLRYLRSWEAGKGAPTYINDEGIECYKVTADRWWWLCCRIRCGYSNTWNDSKNIRI